MMMMICIEVDKKLRNSSVNDSAKFVVKRFEFKLVKYFSKANVFFV